MKRTKHNGTLLSELLSRNISKRRKELGLTQAELGQLVQLESESVARFERGIHLPPLKTLEKLSIALKTNVVDLLDPPDDSIDGDIKTFRRSIVHLSDHERELILNVIVTMSTYFQREAKRRVSQTKALSGDPENLF